MKKYLFFFYLAITPYSTFKTNNLQLLCESYGTRTDAQVRLEYVPSSGKHYIIKCVLEDKESAQVFGKWGFEIQ